MAPTSQGGRSRELHELLGPELDGGPSGTGYHTHRGGLASITQPRVPFTAMATASANSMLVIEGDRAGVVIVRGDAGLDGGLHRKLQSAPEFEHACLGIGEDVADQGGD